MCELHAKCVMLGRSADCIELSDCKARLEVKLCLESAITNEKCQVLDPPNMSIVKVESKISIDLHCHQNCRVLCCSVFLIPFYHFRIISYLRFQSCIKR